MRRFWKLAAGAVRSTERYDDQELMWAVEDHHPGEVGRLSPAWDIHLAGGLWKHLDLPWFWLHYLAHSACADENTRHRLVLERSEPDVCGLHQESSR